MFIGAQAALFGPDVDEEYLYSLGSLGWEGVRNEGVRVQLERDALLEETLELAFGNYKTFIEASEVSKAVDSRLESIQGSMQKVGQGINGFSEACETFQKQAEVLSEQRKATSLVLEKHTRLLEILELPQLTETCVRNGSYEEALELQRYALKLDKKLGSIPLIANIVQSVKDSSHLMLNQLLLQLKTQIALPACLRVVGYLRRMDVYSESELRLRFLQARESWLNGLLSSLPRSQDSYDYLSKVMELTRVHLLEIITQYKAIFTDEDPLLGGSSTSHRQLFSAWIQRRVGIFIGTLKEELNKPVKSSLDALLGQAMYFGQSLGRVGVDFRVLLIPVFTQAIRNSSLSFLNDAELRFRIGMDKIALKNYIISAPPNAHIADKRPEDPPLSILEFLPLAELMNSILDCLNETRLSAPLSLCMDIRDRLESLLLSVTSVLANYPRGRFSDTENTAFIRLLSVYASDFIPFVIGSLYSVFPKDQVAKSIGVPLAELKDLKKGPLIEALRHLLPQEEVNRVPEVVIVETDKMPLNKTMVDSKSVECSEKTSEVSQE